jgi:hypothetical protein
MNIRTGISNKRGDLLEFFSPAHIYTAILISTIAAASKFLWTPSQSVQRVCLLGLGERERGAVVSAAAAAK